MGNYIEELTNFCQNKGLLNPNRPPQINEPFYSDWMAYKLKQMGIKLGDTLSVVAKKRLGEENTIVSGILISDISSHSITLLTSGKKVWNNRKNEEMIYMNDIISIEKTKDAALDFDIKEVVPYYQTVEEYEKNREKNPATYTVSDCMIEKFRAAYPNLNFHDYQILCLGFSFYWPYANGKITKAEIAVVKKDGTVLELPKSKVAQVYPNKNWYSVVGLEKESEYLFMPFSTLKELQEVKYVSCLWTINTDDMKEQFLQISYPIFIPDEKKRNIYNVGNRAGTLEKYAEGLHSHSVFSEALYIDYDFAGYQYDGEILQISGDLEDGQAVDILNILNDHDLEKVIGMFLKDFKDNSVEILISKDNISASHYFSDQKSCQELKKKKKERVCLEKFFVN